MMSGDGDPAFEGRSTELPTEYSNLEAGKKRLVYWLDDDQLRSIIRDTIFKGNVDGDLLPPRIKTDPASSSYYAYDLLSERTVRDSLHHLSNRMVGKGSLIW